MKNEINAVLENVTATTPEQSDYTGGDGLLYCGKCHKPKEAYFAPDKAAIFGCDRHPAECDCQRAAREEREAAEKRRRHLDTVEELKRRGFTDPTMRDWTFENEKCETGKINRCQQHSQIRDEQARSTVVRQPPHYDGKRIPAPQQRNEPEQVSDFRRECPPVISNNVLIGNSHQQKDEMRPQITSFVLR